MSLLGASIGCSRIPHESRSGQVDEEPKQRNRYIDACLPLGLPCMDYVNLLPLANKVSVAEVIEVK